MTGWMKLKDELISRSVLMSVLFGVPLLFKAVPPENLDSYVKIAVLGIGTGIAKTVQNAVKSYNNSKKVVGGD